MTADANATIDGFLTALAAKQPAPGGGSVAALAGALAAAMGEMVLNYSVGKKDLAAHEPALREALTELTRARAMLLELLIENEFLLVDLFAKDFGSLLRNRAVEFVSRIREKPNTVLGELLGNRLQ